MTGYSLREFAATAPTPPDGNTTYASNYAMQLRRVVMDHAARAPRTLQRHLGPSELGSPCLAGDTEIVTRSGIRRIADVAAEGHAELLVPMLYEGSNVRKKWGRFVDAPVQYFGDQPLYNVVLRRGSQERKTVRATAEHRWYRSFYRGRQKTQESLITAELRPGHRLTQLRRAMPHATTLMHWAVSQGFVFGDGTQGTQDDRHRPATLQVYHNGKSKAMLDYFPGDWPVIPRSDCNYAYSRVTGLPRFWKELPPIDESVSFLLSWLAGYFAADGSVTDDGHCRLSSARCENLEFVRDVAAICGIGYGSIQKAVRLGINQDAPSDIYYLSLRRRDLPSWFFLRDTHAERVNTANLKQERDSHWIVESVSPTGVTAPVYCARIDGIGAFALADDLMTGNCDRQVAGKMAGLPSTNHVADPWPSIVGVAVHSWMEKAFIAENKHAGINRWLTETHVAPHPEHPGTSDLYDGWECNVVDHKGVYVDTPVPTPDGWTTIGALNVGDLVFGADGKVCRVTRTYPAQLRDCYRLTFADGSELITDDVQELPFHTTYCGKDHDKHMSATTAAGYLYTKKPKPPRSLRLYNGDPLILPKQKLLVHPYVLGCWLGDGGVHGGTISKPDEELYANITACGYKVGAPIGERKITRTVYGLSTQLQKIGLQWVAENQERAHHRLAGCKRIPAEYLRADYQQRLALLQGLMDTDGTWNKVRKQAVFTTTNKDLAYSTAELVRTLGWKVAVFPQQARGFGLTVTAYHVSFTPFDDNPFRLSRKADLVRIEGSRVARFHQLKSIVRTITVPTRCIDVDSPNHLYLCGEGMLPVHNCLGTTSMDKLKRKGPSILYEVQIKLYAHGFRLLGLPVRRVVIAAWPRTRSSLSGLYVWEQEYDPARDDALVQYALDVTEMRKIFAEGIRRSQISLMDVPATPIDDICVFCPFYRPQAAHDPNTQGCPGHAAKGAH